MKPPGYENAHRGDAEVKEADRHGWKGEQASTKHQDCDQTQWAARP
jgi:hypothetical protein